ncbi:hypothetical protein pb186bvf_007978 [Paramecium bursaria]
MYISESCPCLQHIFNSWGSNFRKLLKGENELSLHKFIKILIPIFLKSLIEINLQLYKARCQLFQDSLVSQQSEYWSQLLKKKTIEINSSDAQYYSSYLNQKNMRIQLNQQQKNIKIMLFFIMQIIVQGQYTIYPTINSTFQYPLDKVFEDKGFVYDILESQSPFTIQQAIIERPTQSFDNIDNIIYSTRSYLQQDKYLATLSYQKDIYIASVFQVDNTGELIYISSYTVYGSQYKCYNLVLYEHNRVIINCIQLRTNFITLFQFGQIHKYMKTFVTVNPKLVQYSAISITVWNLVLTYQFQNQIEIYWTMMLNINPFQIEENNRRILNGTYLKIYYDPKGLVYALQSDSITIYDNNVPIIKSQQVTPQVIKAPWNTTFIDFKVEFDSYETRFKIIHILSDHQVVQLHIYKNGTYLQYSQQTFKQKFSKLFTSKNSILLCGDNQLAYYRIDKNGYIQYYNYIKKNTKCQNLIYLEETQLLYCFNKNQYTSFQQAAPYLYTKNGVQNNGSLILKTTNIDGFADFITIKYKPLQPDDKGIYYQYENDIKYNIEGTINYSFLDLSQIIVGSNLSYHIGTDQQMQGLELVHTSHEGYCKSKLCSIMFSQFSNAWVQACFQDEELTVEILGSKFYHTTDTVYIQKIKLIAKIIQVNIQVCWYSQRMDEITLGSLNKIYIYWFQEFEFLKFQQVIDMAVFNQDIQIQDIQTLYSTKIILTQNPNRVYTTYRATKNLGAIQMQLDYSREILQIATNTQSYEHLLINQIGQSQIVSFWNVIEAEGYKMIQTIKYPDGYLKSIIGPVSSGIFFYCYTETKSELYFLQKEFIQQKYIQPNMFFTKVDTSSYQLVQNKLTYSYSNKFFYVVCQDNKGNLLLNIYQGSYQAIKILRSSLYLFEQPQQLASTIYQEEGTNYGADLIILPASKGLNQRFLIAHKPYLTNLTEFSWQQNYQIKIKFSVNDNFTQKFVQSTLSVNQSYLQLTQQPKHLLNQTYKIKNNKFNFDVSKMFNGPITDYQLLCDGCEIQSYQLPIDDKFDTYKKDYSSYLLKEEEHNGKKTQILYLLKKDGSLSSIDINTKSEQFLEKGGYTCCTQLFQEINTNNPSWACQNGTYITFFTYNQQKKKIQPFSVQFLQNFFDSTYTLGNLQLFSLISDNDNTSFYSIIQYNIEKKNGRQHVQILKNLYPINTVISQSYPIIFDDNIDHPLIGLIGINYKRIQYLIIANISMNETSVRVLPEPFKSFNTQNSQIYQIFQIGKPEIRDNLYSIKLYQSGFINSEIFELQYEYPYSSYTSQQSICYFNQLNYSFRNFNNYVATSNGKKLMIIQNKIDSTIMSELLIYDLDQCRSAQLVNPYQSLKLSLNIANYSIIGYLNHDTLIYSTLGELSIFKSTGQVSGTYQETEDNPTVSLIALNPISQVLLSLPINENQNIQNLSGLACNLWLCVYKKAGYLKKNCKWSRKQLPSNEVSTVDIDIDEHIITHQIQIYQLNQQVKNGDNQLQYYLWLCLYIKMIQQLNVLPCRQIASNILLYIYISSYFAGVSLLK